MIKSIFNAEYNWTFLPRTLTREIEHQKNTQKFCSRDLILV